MAKDVLSCKAVITKTNKQNNTIKKFILNVAKKEYIDFYAMSEYEKILFVCNHKNTVVHEKETFDSFPNF